MSRPRPSSPSVSPSRSAPSRTHDKPLPTSTHRRVCADASRRGVAFRVRGRPVASRSRALRQSPSSQLRSASRSPGRERSAQQFSAALGPTDLAPQASGDATLTKTSSGWRIELDAAGLPRLDAGRFYEAWLKNAAGVLVPIGTFNEGRNVTLWAGVSPKQFTTLSVTRERADGDQTSSGEKVLVGTVDTSG